MAERGRTVRVTGLPTELQEDRLQDKLCIHFQRSKNGGGEVVSVTTVKTSPDYALITFEDSRVAQRVVQQNQHILEVDGKYYNLSVNEHPGGRDQDKVIINLSATIDCSQLSKRTLKSLIKSHPHVQTNFRSAQELCTLSGSYSEVQAALAQLVGQPELPRTAENKVFLKTSDDNKPNNPTPVPRAQVSHDQSRSLTRDTKEKPLVEKHTSHLHRDITPGGYDQQGQVKGATASSPSPEEDFSLMVDADMFQYLQKYCSEEYHQILRQHGVAVVDFTHQGLTTLLLQIASGDGVHDQECLRKAREQISRLYVENQANVCRDKLLKAIIPNREILKRVIEKLSGRFTKLLFTEDEQNVYIIGSRTDVAEAKRFLLLHDHTKEDKTDVTSPRRFQDSWPGEEVRVPSASLTNHGSLDHNGLDQTEDEGKPEGSSRVRLAAQFKDPRLPPLGSKTAGFALRGQTNKQSRPGPVLGYDVLSDAKGNPLLKDGAPNTGGDILFTSGDTLLQNSWTTDVLDTRPKIATVSPTHSDNLSTPSTATLGSSLRRASSFSGLTRKRDQEISSISDTEAVVSRGRSSSFSGSKPEQHNAEVTVNSVMWLHITVAFKPLLEELTVGVQYREKHTERGNDTTILLTGTDSSRVSSCQQGLQRLIDSVSVDFTICSLKLSELGVTGTPNEELELCCTDIRSRYKKLSIQIYDKTLYVFGPKVLCSQVCETIREVFFGAHHSTQQDYSRPSTSSGSDSYRNSPASAANGQAGKAGVKDGSKRRDLRETELVNGQVSPRRDAVTKEKVKRPDSVEMDVRNAPESVKSGIINGSVTTQGDQNKTKRDQTEGDRSMAAAGGPGCKFCDRAGVQVKRTKCGVTICSDCQDKVHSQCRVCEQREQPKARGIHGDMNYGNLPMSITGYNRDNVIKITYRIQDGFQGEGHPSPGKPFKGATFEAFLPNCEQARKLLPRLQEAFNRGLTFTVTGDKVNWDTIPHKTSMQGGKSGSGYPDSTYLSRLSDTLRNLGV